MLKAKVASLIDNRTLALNIGKKNKVTEDMIFQIFDEKGKKIEDPDTKSELGYLRLPKIKVKVTHVFDSYCVAETFQFKEINIGGTNTVLSGLGGYLAPPKYVKKYETFELDKESKKVIEEERSIVKVGDLAEQIKISEPKSI